MALFTDGNMANLNDLRSYESSVLDLAGTEGIDLGSKLTLAHRELEFEVVGFLLRHGQISGSGRELDHVLVTEPMLHAEILLTLAQIYRDALNSQLNDRYEGKSKQYSELSRRAIRQLFEIGVGITYSPLHRPQPPLSVLLTGGFRPGTTYGIRTAVVGMNGSTSSPSEQSNLEARPGMILGVTLGDLPSRAIGWVLCVSDGEGPMLRQNEQPLPAGSIWTCPGEGIRTDLPLLVEQAPDYYVINRQEILRG